ncbi:MAG: tail fiber domain-containing protein [Candidatus Margulisbacteria bacterium]|nr:tail fiber domain-containing protein [Candidatus Margulisiibacteriota bacterium]
MMLVVGFAALATMAASPGWGAVPMKFSVQGKTQPAAPGSVTILGIIYDGTAGSNPPRTTLGPKTVTADSAGVFNVAFDLDANDPYLLSGNAVVDLNVYAGTTTSGTALGGIAGQKLYSSPYALRAAVAESLPGVTVSNGNVGIGITNPTQKLEVDGNISANYSNNNPYIYLNNANRSTGTGAGWVLWGGGGPFNLSSSGYSPSGGGESVRLSVARDGNVGIGTTAPGVKLEVSGSGGSNKDLVVNGRIQTGDSNNFGGVWFDNTNKRFIGAGAGNNLSFWNNGDWRMNIADNGNVGIGTATVNDKLEVSGSAIRLSYSAEPSRYYARLLHTVADNAPNANTLQFSITNRNAGDVINTGTPLTLTGAGNVGIGTTIPYAGLHVKTPTGVTYSTGIYVESADGVAIQAVGNSWGVYSSSGKNYFGGNVGIGTADLGSGGLFVGGGRKVGIGTKDPRFPLEITGSTYFYQPNGGMGLLPTAQDVFIVPGSNYYYYSMACDQGIAAAKYHAFSDSRIKEGVTKSDSADDLKTLNNLAIVDFKYVDKISKGSNPQKGLIAQQVEDILPQAVSKMTDFIPNIYQKAERAVVDAGAKTLTLTMMNVPDLKAGDSIRLIFKDKDGREGVEEKEVVSIAGRSFVVKEWGHDASDIIVYGKKVADFRNLDYNYIFSTGISAIQELSKKVESQQKQIDDLTAQLEKLEKAAK